MAYSFRLESLRDLIAAYTRDIVSLDRRIHAALKDDTGYNAIQVIHGVGPVLAAVFVAEIGDVTRFPSPDRLCSWAGLTPKHRESDTKVRRGSITKQGSKLVRWAAVEAISRNHGGRQDQGRLPPHRRAAGSQHRPRRRGPQSASPRLLRPA